MPAARRKSWITKSVTPDSLLSLTLFLDHAENSLSGAFRCAEHKGLIAHRDRFEDLKRKWRQRNLYGRPDLLCGLTFQVAFSSARFSPRSRATSLLCPRGRVPVAL